MWLKGIDGSHINIWKPTQVLRHWFNENSVGPTFPRPKLPFKIYVEFVPLGPPLPTITVILSEWDNEADMDKAFTELCKMVNAQFYLPPESGVRAGKRWFLPSID